MARYYLGGNEIAVAEAAAEGSTRVQPLYPALVHNIPLAKE